MTNNARDEKWSEWIEWHGAMWCPLPINTPVEVEFRDGSRRRSVQAMYWAWKHKEQDDDIIAYRYKIKEPESDMHPYLEWLARNVSEWDDEDVSGCGGFTHVRKEISPNGTPIAVFGYGRSDHPWWHQSQWLQARKDLGLIMSDEEEEIPAPEWAGNVPEGVVTHDKYSAYFKDVRHIDTLDVYRVVSLFDCEKHGHPISHAAKKLLLSGSRTGGKDVESDVREAIDTLYRWLEMREEDRRA